MTLRRTLVSMLGGLALAAAGAAGAAEGWGILVAKDPGSSTLTLKTGVVLHVDEQTRITDREGNALTMMDLVPAREMAGGLEVRGENQLRWEGQRSGDQQVDASRVIVWGEEVR